MGKFRYRIPGYWRPKELREEIERRTGLEMSRDRFKYLIGIGIIPPGSERNVLTNNPSARGMVQVWTDRDVEDIIVRLNTYVTPVRDPSGRD